VTEKRFKRKKLRNERGNASMLAGSLTFVLSPRNSLNLWKKFVEHKVYTVFLYNFSTKYVSLR